MLVLGLSLNALARGLGESTATVSRWRTGARLPTAKARAKIHDVYGIPSASWGVKPGTKPPAGRLAAPARIVSPQTLDQARAHVIELEADLRTEGLMPAEVVRLRVAKTQALKLVSDLEERELTREDRIAESPAWVRIARTLEEALRPFPAAARAVGKAMRGIGEAR